MRRFRVKNQDGKLIDLTGKTILFCDVSGLGASYSEEYREIGSRFALVNRKMDQGSITGTVAFYGSNPYKQYQEFCNTVLKKNGLCSLQYSIDDGKTYYSRIGRFTSIEKAELNLAGFLAVSVTFTAATPWFRSVKVSTVSSNSKKDNGWKWEKYDSNSKNGRVRWHTGKLDEEKKVTNKHGVIKFKSTKMMSVSIESNSDIASPCSLTIHGPITNPKWTHYLNGSAISTGAVTCTVGTGERLVVDNLTDTYRMRVLNENNEVVANVYQKSDFSTDRFINLKRGTNSIFVTGTTSKNVTIEAEGRIYYATV